MTPAPVRFVPYDRAVFLRAHGPGRAYEVLTGPLFPIRALVELMRERAGGRPFELHLRGLEVVGSDAETTDRAVRSASVAEAGRGVGGLGGGKGGDGTESVPGLPVAHPAAPSLTARCGHTWGLCPARSARSGTCPDSWLRTIGKAEREGLPDLRRFPYGPADRPHLCLLSHDAHPRRLEGAHRCEGCGAVSASRTLPIRTRSTRLAAFGDPEAGEAAPSEG